jgi:DNA-binding response OmpR family regulator
VTGSHTPQAAERVSVILYSHQPQFRAAVLMAVGRRPAVDVPRIDWLECSTSAQVIEQIDLGDVALVVLDGESQPTGGMGLARQFKYEITDCPPVLVVVARRDDRWLAAWSLADAVISAPLDPVEAAAAVAEQLRVRRAGIPVVR